MSGFPAITVRVPQPHDIVAEPLLVTGTGSGFDGSITARVRDGNGVELVLVTIPAGGIGIWQSFQAAIELRVVPPTPRGTLEVFDVSPRNGSEMNKVVIPIVFGSNLVDQYRGYAQHMVVRGDTLSVIAKQAYGAPEAWQRIYEANRHQLNNPNALVVGQVLRVPQAVPRRGNQGLQFGAVIDNAGHIVITDRDLDALAQAGAGWLKLNFRLGRFQNWTEKTTFGYSALSLYDQVVAKAKLRGLNVVGLLSNEAWHGQLADWRANNAEQAGGNGNNPYLTQFAQSVAVPLAQHFADRITTWEVWNEPSQQLTHLYPSNFAWLLANVYTAAKSANLAQISFISGGITAEQDQANALTAASVGADYLSQTYAQGLRLAGWQTIKATYGSYPLDSIGQHLYFDSFTTTTAARITRALDLLRNAYAVAEGGNTPKRTIVTEFGWTTKAVSPLVQAANLRIAYAQIRATSYVQNAYWFYFRDEPTPDLYFGLVNPDGAAKPAWYAYKLYAQ